MEIVAQAECQHKWEPCSVLREPGRVCCSCGEWEQITKTHFKQLFRKSFWKHLKEYEDAHVFGGYKTSTERRRENYAY